jgi:hypothetical protein
MSADGLRVGLEQVEAELREFAADERKDAKTLTRAEGAHKIAAAIAFEISAAAVAGLLHAIPPAAPDWIEQRLRMEWWTGHGCSYPALYGDDGEMQCNALTCRKDFKRLPMEELRDQRRDAERQAHWSDVWQAAGRASVTLVAHGD